MRLLLDTHLLLWAAYRPDRIPTPARELIENPANELFFSAASIWEIAIKAGLGREDFSVDVGELTAGLRANTYTEIAIEAAHCLGLAQLPAIHSDPFDRLLLCQAQTLGVSLLTADQQLIRYGEPVVPA